LKKSKISVPRKQNNKPIAKDDDDEREEKKRETPKVSS
jgi:hypothetical protein